MDYLEGRLGNWTTVSIHTDKMLFTHKGSSRVAKIVFFCLFFSIIVPWKGTEIPLATGIFVFICVILAVPFLKKGPQPGAILLMAVCNKNSMSHHPNIHGDAIVADANDVEKIRVRENVERMSGDSRLVQLVVDFKAMPSRVIYQKYWSNRNVEAVVNIAKQLSNLWNISAETIFDSNS